MLTLIITGCSSIDTSSETKEEINSGYAVFLGLEGNKAVKESEGYKTVVIDAQYLSEKEIASMQERNQKVYSYINIGSLENYRSYYQEYKKIRLSPYVDWEEEYWLDVTNKEWQEFIREELSEEFLEKGVDGFFVANVDVYGQFPNPDTYKAIETILKDLMSHKLPLIINSGDDFVKLYLHENKQVNDILTGVNQETVFSTINFDTKTFSTQKKEDQEYYLEYLNLIEEEGKDIFLLEYSKDKKLIKKISEYAKKRGWQFYVSGSIELDGVKE